MSTPVNDPPLRWAAKLQPGRIQRVYEQDARGLVDDDLLNDVGWALFERCRSILLVSSGRYPARAAIPSFGSKGQMPPP